jgi:hypothetical protein
MIDEIRQQQHIESFPCKYRGRFHSIEEMTGKNCAVEPAPAYLCSLPSNQQSRCTLWRYCTRQTLPICMTCEDRTE